MLELLELGFWKKKCIPGEDYIRPEPNQTVTKILYKEAETLLHLKPVSDLRKTVE